MNLALRCEVLYYTTTGIIQAVKDTNHLPPGATQQALYLQPQGVDLSARDSLGVDDYLMSEQGVKVGGSSSDGHTHNDIVDVTQEARYFIY